MSRRAPVAATVFLLFGAIACEREPETVAEKELLLPADGNATSLANGAVVVHRTGEMSLRASAICVIDSEPRTAWVSAPRDRDESLTIALAGPAQIRKIGVSDPKSNLALAARKVDFEWSADGSTFRPLTSITRGDGETVVEVDPVTASFLRVRATEPATPGAQAVALPDILCEAELPSAPDRKRIDGVWKINRITALLASDGSRVSGVTDEVSPRGIEGGWEGRLVRFAWSRDNEFGPGIASIDPAGNHLNAIIWYIRPAPPFYGTTWFGARRETSPPSAPAPNVMEVFLRMSGRFPLYGLEYEGTELSGGSGRTVSQLAALVGANPQGRFRFVAHEVGTESAEADLRLATAKLDVLRNALREAGVDPARATFVPAGRGEAIREPDTPWTPLQKILNNRIDLELTPAAP